MSLQAAMLRGVNLGKRQVIMSELREVCEEAGFTDVRTLLASGNIVLGSDLKGQWLENKLEQVIHKALGLKTDVFVRTATELKAIVKANTFKSFAETDPSHLVVLFMRAKPTAEEISTTERTAAHETVHVGKNCLYITYPDGQARSKLKLPKLGTARNWNTVTKLAAMTAEA